MTPLGCNHQSFACPSYSLYVQLLWYPMYYPEEMKARVSPVQWSKPHSILAPTQDSNPSCRIQNHKRWPLHYHCTTLCLRLVEIPTRTLDYILSQYWRMCKCVTHLLTLRIGKFICAATIRNIKFRIIVYFIIILVNSFLQKNTRMKSTFHSSSVSF